MIEALPRPFHPHGASPLTAWRRARQPLLPVRSRGYLPEHIPQWLPDDWFTAAGLNPSEPFLGRSVVFRRFAAVQLVQMATGMLFEKAAYFLGIPESWHQTPERLKRLLTFLVGSFRSFVRSGGPGVRVWLKRLMSMVWLSVIGRPVPRDDTATHWDARSGSLRKDTSAWSSAGTEDESTRRRGCPSCGRERTRARPSITAR
jgi:hypothetical protein